MPTVSAALTESGRLPDSWSSHSEGSLAKLSQGPWNDQRVARGRPEGVTGLDGRRPHAGARTYKFSAQFLPLFIV